MRTNISFKLRKAIFERDRFRCQCCGATNKQSKLEVDHIIPVSKDGTNDFDNLATLCIECNRGKSDELLRITTFQNKLTKHLERIQAQQNKAELDKLRKFKINNDDLPPTIKAVLELKAEIEKELNPDIEKQLPKELQLIKQVQIATNKKLI